MHHATDRLGLKQIVAIDAHVTGKVICLRVDKHANITGTNGAGKTTLLKLIPLFYGAEPGRVMPRRGVKKTLVEYLLPRKTSLIVYEYTTPHGPVCSVMYRHSSGMKPVYRFVRSPFSMELFQHIIDGEQVFMEGRELGERWRSIGVECSPQLENVMDYRAVVQGDRSLLSRSAEAAQLNRLAMTYSLGGRNNTMSRMHLVTHAVLERNTSIESIHSLIANILEENRFILPTASLSQKLPEQVANIRALSRVEEEIDFLRRVEADGELFVRTQGELEALSLELGRALALAQSELEAIQLQEGDLFERQHLLKRSHEEKDSALSERLADIKTEVETRQNQVDLLMAARDEYDEADAESRRLEQDNLTAYEDTLKDHKARLRDLLEGVQDIERDYVERRRKSENQYQVRDGALRDTVEKLTGELSKLVSERDEEKARADQLHQARIEAITTGYQERESQHSTRIGELRFFSKQDTQSDAERLALEEAEAALEVARARQEESSAQRDRAHTELDQANKAREEALKQHAEREKRVRHFQSQRDDLTKRITPAPGTWLAALHREQPDWFNGVGRLIRPEVLHDARLTPSLSEPDSATVMGWSIETDKLDKPDWAASIEDLQLQLLALEEKTAEAEGRLSVAAIQLERANAAAEEASRQYERARHDFRRSGDIAKEAADTVKAVKHDNRQAAAARRADAEQQLRQEEAGLVKLRKNRAAEIEAEKGIASERKNEIHGQFGIDISDKEYAIRAAKDERTKEAGKLKISLAAHERDFHELCDKAGLDVKVQQRMQAEVEAAQALVDKVLGDRDYVNQYIRWLSSEWALHRSMTDILAGKERELREALTSLEQARDAFKAEKAELDRQQRQLEASSSKTKADAQTIKEWMDKLPPTDSVSIADDSIEGEPATRDLRMLEPEAQRLSTQHDELKKSIRKGVDRAEGIFCYGGEGSGVRQAWELERQAQRATLDDPDDSDALRLQMTKGIRTLLTETIPSLRENEVTGIGNAGQQLVVYFKELKNSQNQIKSESRQISRAISGKMHFAAISDLEISLNSQIEQQEFWPELEKFVRVWEEWEATNSQALPPTDICDLLITMNQLVSRSGLGTSIQDIFTLQISLKENGRQVVAKNSNDMEGMSSNGIGYLVLMSIYASITRMLCNVPEVCIHWPVDELAVLSIDNVAALFNMFDELGIVMVSGFPSTERNFLSFFERHHGATGQAGLIEKKLPEDKLDRLLANLKETREAEGVK